MVSEKINLYDAIRRAIPLFKTTKQLDELYSRVSYAHLMLHRLTDEEFKDVCDRIEKRKEELSSK